MKLKFIQAKIDLKKLDGIDVLVNSSDVFCSGGGGFDLAVHQAAGPKLAEELQRIRSEKPNGLFDKKIIDNGRALVTDGFGLGVKKIVHAAVPRKIGDSIEPLQKCYENALMAASYTDDYKTVKTVAVRLMGTGYCGWTPAESLDALWQALMDYHRRPENLMSDRIENLQIFYPSEVFQIAYRYMNRASQAFFVKPGQWGLRGDPFLWIDLMNHFDNPDFDRISPRGLILEIQRFYHKKTGHWLCADTNEFVAEYAHGGMSSGGISDFMALRGIPLLCRTLSEVMFHSHYVLMVQAAQVDNVGAKSDLMLPVEAIPDLAILHRNQSEINERMYMPMPDGRMLTIYHYPGRPDMIDFCFLDDHLISAEEVRAICDKRKCNPIEFPTEIYRFLCTHSEDDMFDF